jgi:hypothetical protein
MKGKDASRGKLKTEACRKALMGSMPIISENAKRQPTTRHGYRAVSLDDEGRFKLRLESCRV